MRFYRMGQLPVLATCGVVRGVVCAIVFALKVESNRADCFVSSQLASACALGRARFECIQPMYNLAKRQVEVEILPLARSEQLGVISYSPLGGGLLTGKYGVDKRPEGGRLLQQDNYIKRYANPLYYELADRFAAYASERSVHPATLALAWAKGHPDVTAPIIGGRNSTSSNPRSPRSRSSRRRPWSYLGPVSYTHLTLPTNREV